MIFLGENDTGFDFTTFFFCFFDDFYKRTYRDDMGGVGSFLKENRTLHITGYQRGKVNEVNHRDVEREISY